MLLLGLVITLCFHLFSFLRTHQQFSLACPRVSLRSARTLGLPGGPAPVLSRAHPSLLWAQCPAVGAPLVASPESAFLPEVPCQTPNQAFLFRYDTRCPFCFLGFAGSSGIPSVALHFVCVLCSEFPLVHLCASSGMLRPLPWSCIFPVGSGGSGGKRVCSPHLTLLKLRPPQHPSLCLSEQA